MQTYHEYIGRLKKLEVSDSEVAVTLSLRNLRIVFPAGSGEAEILAQELNHVPLGQKIALLKTDDYKRPILVRRL